ncbi:MAG TPA: porin [Roseateles sp.]|nr:porin [Roseateles sp.]
MNSFNKASLALAALMAAGACSAQVSLGGRIDQSVVKSSPGKWEVTHGSANRLIFKAEDDLGDGMKAYGYLQHRFLGDTGQPRSGPFWYYSYVGLKGKFGDIRLGHQKSPIDDATGSDYEVWDGDTVASSYSRIAGNQKIWDNGVNYTSPSLGGFSINVGVSPSEGVAKTVRGQGMSLIYEVGGLSASLSTQRSPTNVHTDAIGGRYVTESFRILGTWATSTRVGGSKKQTDLQLSAGYQVTPQGEARILYNRSRLVSSKTEVWGLGYFHFLSKRTALYAAWSDTRAPSVESVNAYQAGVRHSF